MLQWLTVIHMYYNPRLLVLISLFTSIQSPLSIPKERSGKLFGLTSLQCLWTWVLAFPFQLLLTSSPTRCLSLASRPAHIDPKLQNFLIEHNNIGLIFHALESIGLLAFPFQLLLTSSPTRCLSLAFRPAHIDPKLKNWLFDWRLPMYFLLGFARS